MKKLWEEYKGILFGGFILAVIALWCVIRMMIPTKEWDFPAKNLICEGGVYFEAGVLGDVPGMYLDNGMEYGEVFASNPAVNLEAGSYEIRIDYLTETDGQSYSFISEYPTYKVIMGREKSPLEPGRQSKTLSVYYWDTVNGFQVNTQYGGEGYLLVKGIHIMQTRALERMILCIELFFLLAMLLFYRMKKRKRSGKILLCGIAAALLAGIPLMCPCLYDGDDLAFHLLRIEGIAQGLLSGQFPVRIQPEWMNGYGYPVSVFYGDGILFIAGLLRVIGFPLQLSYKIYIFILNGMTFAAAYYCINRIFRNQDIAATGGFIYTLAPYRLINIYLRGAVGEFTALTFFPLIFVGFYEIIVKKKEERRFSWFILACGLTGIIQSHILSCEIVGLFAIAICILFWKKIFQWNKIVDFIKCIIVTIGANLFFIVPFLSYMKEDFYINSEEFGGRIQTTGIYLNQLLDFFPHGYGDGLSVVEGLDGAAEMPLVLGTVFLIGMILAVYELYKRSKADRQEFQLGKFCFWSSLVVIWMCTIWFPWDRLYHSNKFLALLISKLQFSWRLLGLAGMLLTILLCAVLFVWQKRGKKWFWGLLAVLFSCVFVTDGSFFSSLIEKNDVIYVADIESVDSFYLVGGEYVPSGVDWKREKMQADQIWSSGGIQISEIEKQGTIFRFSCTVDSATEQYVEIPLLYYRGYQATDIKRKSQMSVCAGDNGKIRINLPAGFDGSIQVAFEEPFSWRISELISLITLLLIGTCFLKVRYWENGNKVKRN